MQGKENPPPRQRSRWPMPATDDEIREKYLERAIRELNSLSRARSRAARTARAGT